MNSKGYHEIINALRGRSWTTTEALELKFYIDIATKVLPKMNQVTHIIVSGEEQSVPNPYWSENNSRIEPKSITEFKQSVTHLYSEKEFKNYLTNNPNIVGNRNKYAFYKVEQLFPKITTTVTIDV